ncbi:hypothetical protein BV25DRAFT_1805628, partial [Artomyces pyxidatus]
LKVEWFRTRARAKRWTEEVLFLDEEMRRCIQTCLWKASWWASRGMFRDVRREDPDLQDGLCSYAAKQGSTYERTASQWQEDWVEVREVADKFLCTHAEDGYSLEQAVDEDVDID